MEASEFLQNAVYINLRQVGVCLPASGERMQFWNLVPANPCVLLRGVQYGVLGTPESELAVLTHVAL